MDGSFADLGNEPPREPRDRRPRSRAPRVLGAAVVLLIVVTAIALAVTWPRERPIKQQGGKAIDTVLAEVTKIEETECQAPGANGCVRATGRVIEGRGKGDTGTFIAGDTSAEIQLSVGDRVRLVKSLVEPGSIEGVEVEPYAFSDFDRAAPMLWLAALFAAVVLFAGRWKGLRALIGLVASLGVVLFYLVPALLQGEQPLVAAVIGSFAVMLLVIPLAHGWGLTTIAATLGTGASLLLTMALATAFVSLTHLTGFGNEEAAYLAANTEGLSIRGLLLAGIVIGALGVLDDVTITQASAVLALRQAAPGLGFWQLFRRAMSVGRDHVTAAVNTLVLAYAGASLPALLVFAVADFPVRDAVNGEAVAQQVVATLVGSIGLIAAVPVTTALAAMLALHVRPDEIDTNQGHSHSHTYA